MKLSSNQSLTIFLIVFIDLLGFGLILPLLPYIAERFNANAFQIGLLSATYSLFQFIATPILGRLSDKYGRRSLLIISQLGSAAGYLLLGWAYSLPLVFLSRVIDGITGGNISIASAYMADITNPKNRAKGMGLIGAAFGLGFMIGPAIGGLLSHFGFWVPALAAATMATLAAGCTYFFLPETVSFDHPPLSAKATFAFSRLKQLLFKPPFGLLILTFFLLNLAFSGMQGTFALWAQKTYNWGPARVGLQFTYIGVLSVLSQVKLVPYAVKRYGERSVMVNAIPFLAFGLFLIPLALQPWVLLIIHLLIVIGNSLTGPTLQAIATESASPAEYGSILGLLQSAGSLGRIFGPVLGGQLFYVYNKDIPFIVSGLIMFGTYLMLNHFLPPNRTWFNRLFRL